MNVVGFCFGFGSFLFAEVDQPSGIPKKVVLERGRESREGHIEIWTGRVASSALFFIFGVIRIER